LFLFCVNSRRHFLAALPLLASACATNRSSGTSAKTSGDGELRVMTYNLRYASPKSPDSWPERRPAVKALLDKYAPDIFGTQEGLYDQLRDITADQTVYDWIGLGRDGGSRGEFMAVFYRRDRFDVLAYDHFWLSDTPDVIGSSTWGNTNRRMVTSVRFRDRRTGREFHFWNTHLDHALQPAREKGANLIRQRIGKIPADQPLILTGDFNATATKNPAYDILTGDTGLTDSWFTAAKRFNEDLNSFNGFATPKRNGERIDWILYRGAAEIRSAGVIDFAPGGRLPSDHFPVEIRMRWL
jgi:endonuclease/exonuclease/phosphatase family metal-dependent hydrolase